MLRAHVLVVGAGALAALVLATRAVSPGDAARAIDGDLLLVLFALLVAVELLRASGWLDTFVALALVRFRTARAFAVMLIVVTGVLSSIITNDVALFIVIPFTIVASRMSALEVETLIVLEVIGANLLGCLTPLGNPQNLFVFHRSGWSAMMFVHAMLPFTAVAALGLGIAVLLVTRNTRIDVTAVAMPPRDHRRAIAGALCLVLVLCEIARLTSGWPAAVAAFVCGALLLRARMRTIDFSIIPLFLFAFIIVEALRRFDVYRLFDAIPLSGTASKTYVASLTLAQFISNVPAVVLLAPLAHGQWRTLLYGANAGSCGTIIASLANLLGWRIYVRESGRDPRFFWRLTAINFVFLAWIGVGAWLVL